MIAYVVRMPLTFPSHAAAVLPLKLWRPRWFDGVALVVGSTAPDLPYATEPYIHFDAHSWAALALYCVPVTVVLSWLVRRAAPAVAAHVPVLAEYAVLGRHRHRWYIVLTSAYLGALSHRLWDLVTHASMDHGTVYFPWLGAEAFAGQPWWRVLHYGSTVVGAVVVAVLALRIRRTGWLLEGEVPLPAAAPWSGRFWVVAGVVWTVGVAVQPFLAMATAPQVIFVRLLAVFAAGLLAASAFSGVRVGHTPT